MTREPETPIELPVEPAAAIAHRRRGLFFLGLAAAGVGFALSVQLAVNSNFVAQELRITASQQGSFEALREMWGIIAMGVLALLAGFAEPLVAVGALLLMGVGIGAYAYIPSYMWLVVVGMVWSPGFHVWVPLPNSMTLGLAEPNRTGYRLGQIRAAGAAGAGAGLGVSLLLRLVGVQIRPLFVLAGAMALLAAAACLGIPRKIKTPGPRLVFRKKYWLYYVLSFLEGWRKQIFVAFAGYLLVRRYHAPLSTMLALWMCIQGIQWIAAPFVGRLIDRVGERRILVFYFACLTAFFVGYAVIINRYILYVLYVVDSAFFVFAIALPSYVNRIAPKSEHTQTLSMGVAINHVAAVAMPLAGGLLWKDFGYHWAFLIGAAAAALSVLAALCIPPHAKVIEGAPSPTLAQKSK